MFCALKLLLINNNTLLWLFIYSLNIYKYIETERERKGKDKKNITCHKTEN